MADIPYSVFTFIGFFLCIPPMYFNWKIPGRPWATLIFVGWIMIMNGLSFADSVIWRNEDPYTWWDGKVYCDIGSRIKSEFNIGLPAAGVGVCRFLADATNPDPAYTDLKHTRFRRNMIDLFLGIGLPLINMGLKMIVNPTRYWIQGVYGCDGVTDLSWPSILLYHIWCPVLSSIAAIYSVIFLRHWWVRRRRLNEEWGHGTRNGISKAEFRRLQFTVLLVICFYFPFSIYGLVLVLRLPRIPYSWHRIHGARWWIIALIPVPKANLSMWVIPLLAITTFMFIGTTRNARRFFARCVEWPYDHLPKKLSAHLSGMRKISERCKEERNTIPTGGEQNRSMTESKPNREMGAKHWFDNEDDPDDWKSTPSSEITLTLRDDGNATKSDIKRPFSPTETTTEISPGSGLPQWAHGVTVTRQVIVETSAR